MRAARQALLPFNRQARAVNRQIAQRLAGHKVEPGLGRPASKNGRVKHRAREVLTVQAAVHVTMRLRDGMPNLRTRKGYAAVRAAFEKFATLDGFRLVHYAAMSNHIHLLVESDSTHALSTGMRKIAHSISRRLNALSVRTGRGWLGRVFADRYFTHVMGSPTEMQRALRYLFTQAQHHLGHASSTVPDAFSSFVVGATDLLATATGFLLSRICKRPP